MSSSQKVDLKVDWCTYKATKYAVENWHYSRRMPVNKLIKLGVWEDKQFIGVIVFGPGANNHIGEPWKLHLTEVCELLRVALKEHCSTVTEIISVALHKLKQKCPLLRLVVSYADEGQGHKGIIYQAGNWVYNGVSKNQAHLRIHGVLHHGRAISQRYGLTKIDWLKDNVDPNAEWVKDKHKHRYLYPLDKAMRRQIEKLRQPYPKRTPTGGASEPTEAGGSMPTRSLQKVHVI